MLILSVSSGDCLPALSPWLWVSNKHLNAKKHQFFPCRSCASAATCLWPWLSTCHLLPQCYSGSWRSLWALGTVANLLCYFYVRICSFLNAHVSNSSFVFLGDCSHSFLLHFLTSLLTTKINRYINKKTPRTSPAHSFLKCFNMGVLKAFQGSWHGNLGESYK